MSEHLGADECAAIMRSLGMVTDAGRVEAYRALVEPMLGVTALVDSIPLPVSPPRYPRANWRPPKARENPHGAWHMLGELHGAASGRLAGKRIALKDNILLSGVPLANGTQVLGDYTPREDAEIVNRILDAGGSIVGKTVCEAYCFSGGSHTAASGPVRNPRDPARSAGGSSSGSAVVVATGEADMAVGCDQGGSVRMPASFSGICGMKPSWGLVPYTGILGMNFTIDHAGPMTRTVADNALLLEVLAGPDGRDPRQHGARVARYTQALEESVRGLRIGIVAEGFGKPGGERDVDECVRAAAARFAALGAEVREISIPAHAVAGAVTFAGIQGMVTSMFGLDGCVLEHPIACDEDYVGAQRAWRGKVDTLPANLHVALIMSELLRRRHGYRYLAGAMNRVPYLRAQYDTALAEVDLLLMPTTPMKATPIPAPDAPPAVIVEAAFGPTANTGIFNHTHHPAMSVPCGQSDGLPIGMMLIGRHFEEATIYRAAQAFEQG